MPINGWKITTIMLAVVFVHDAKVARRNAEIHKNVVQQNQELTQLVDVLAKQVGFLAAKLDEAGVEITEFDRIAYNNL